MNGADYIVPHSAEAEQSVLGGLLLDNSAFNRVALQAADFYDPRHAAIWSAITGEIATKRPADVITVFERLQSAGKAEECGGLVYLNALAQSVPSAANIRRYAEIVRDHAARRALIATADEALTIAREQRDAQSAIDQITTKFGRLQLAQVRKVPRRIGEVVVERIAHYEALESGAVSPGWPTGIGRLDDLLNGGVRPGELYVLAARPSVGKSSFAQSMAVAFAKQELPTLFLSMEMPTAEVADRAVSNTGRASFSALRSGKMEHEGWARTVDALEALRDIPFYVCDQPALTMFDIRAKARSVPGLRVLVLDYLQLSQSVRKDGNRNAEIEELSRGLKALAKDMQIAVIALSQLNRDVEKRNTKRPMLSDLRDSGAIEQDADVVMFLWPVREFDDGRRLVGLGIDKTRNGRTGSFGLDFHGDTQRWHESTADIHSLPTARARAVDL